MTVVWVALGGALGASARHLLGLAMSRWSRTVNLPLGTVTANVLASFVLGVVGGAVLGGALSPELALLLGTGFCGALSTYSTFALESAELLGSERRGAAVLNVLVTSLASVLAVLLGAALVR